jgi:competence protein ComEC
LSKDRVQGGASSSVENSSLVVVLQVNGRRALFTGDIKEAATAQLAANWGSLGRAQVFLVTHHGSGSGSSSDLLKKIQPRFAVISVGATNTFGHPSPATIDRLHAPPAKTERIYCTATIGTVRATISTSGAIPWKTTGQAAPWWSRTGGKMGLCAGQ